MTKYSIKNSKRGFTIIETMISIGIFLIVVIIGTTSLVNAYAVNRKSQNFRSILDGLSFMMEDVSRSVRTGYNYKCLVKGQSYGTIEELSTPGSCAEGYGIAFESSDGDSKVFEDQWVYFFSDGRLYKSTNASQTNIQINPNGVYINPDKSNILIHGAENPDSGDKQQPLVTVRLTGEIIDKGIATPFSLQTTLSQRMGDI